MKTYEEFLKEKNIENFRSLQIRTSEEEKEVLHSDVSIVGNLEDYIDVLQNAEGLSSIYISEIGDANYYASCRKLIENVKDNINIVHSSLGSIGKANKLEFLQAEEIIDGVVNEINPDWAIKQKLAYVHYKMGELVSYYPDFNFVGSYEENADNTRNIWKSLIEGKSVCNGVTMITRNILSRVGVKTKYLSSGFHSFLLTETEEGNIITDPTWDLSNTLFQARPRFFGKTYEQLLQIDGPFTTAHHLEEEPENVIEISDEELRDIYYSLGLTDEQKKFKIPILDKVNNINEQHFDTTKEKIDCFLSMFTKDFSKEAKHLSETQSMLKSCFGEMGIDLSKLNTKFVYSRNDVDYQKPILALHTNVEGCENFVKMLDLEEMKFVEMELEEFNKQYRQHENNKTVNLGEGIISTHTKTKENEQENEQEQ